MDREAPSKMSQIDEAVRSRYAGLARQIKVNQAAGCCGTEDGCSSAESLAGCCNGYSSEELQQVGLTEGVSLGCGNPTMLADLRAGEIVLDLGSGGGLDVLLSARRVAPGGRAYGVDMTDEMLELAERNRAEARVDNASFLKGTIDAVPLPDSSVDVVISNCVINLAEDKGAVLREAFRVLRPGGRLAVADMVEVEALPVEVKLALEAWAGCIAGTIPVADYSRLIQSAGFDAPEIEVHRTDGIPGQEGRIGSAYIRARKPAGGQGA
jgi:SAM-dependent methyltransferase